MPPPSSSVAHYQARPTYSATSTNQSAGQAVAVAASGRPIRPTAYSHSAYGSVSSPSYSAYGGPSHTVAAAAPAAHKYPPGPAIVPPTSSSVTHGAWVGNHVQAPPQRFPKMRPPPKPQQLHYCDVCKISCAGKYPSVSLHLEWKLLLFLFF